MALLRKLFYRKPPDGLLEISERTYVFDCCFTTDCWNEKNYRNYLAGIVSQLQEQFLEAALLVFNFRKAEAETLVSKIMSEYDMTIMDYPRHYEGCPILPMELIHHFLRSTESWLALGPHNVLLLHCERGGWPVLAFMLSALLLYRKQYTGEQRTLDMVYKQAPRELLPMLSPINPIPSQIRYLQYVSRRNVTLQWPPLDRALTLDCIIFRHIPDFNGEGGCRPIFRIYGRDPLSIENRTPKLLFSTPKKSKTIRLYKKAESELVKVDVNCNIQGDIVLECTSLDKDLEHEEMMFRIMFNTAFIRSNILILNLDEIDTLWDTKNHFPKDFRAEALFSDMDAAAAVVAANSSCFEEKEGLPMEAFAKVQEFFSHIDWIDSKTDAAQCMIENVPVSCRSPRQFDFATVPVLPDAEGTAPALRSVHQESNEEQKSCIFCAKDQDSHNSLYKTVLKKCNLGKRKDDASNFNVLLNQCHPGAIAQKGIGSSVCPNMRMASVSPWAPEKKYFGSPEIKGGNEASGLSEPTPLVPLPLLSSQPTSLSVQENAAATCSMQLPNQPPAVGFEGEQSCEDAHSSLEGTSQSSAIAQSSPTASGRDSSMLRDIPLSPPTTVKQTSVSPIHEDSIVMVRSQPAISSPSPETPSRKDQCFETSSSTPSRLKTAVESAAWPSFSPAAVPVHLLTAPVHEKPDFGSETSPLPNSATRASDNKQEEVAPIPAQLHSAKPFKDFAIKPGPPPPPLPPAPPLKGSYVNVGTPPASFPPQKPCSLRSFSAPLPPPPPPSGHGLQSRQPQSISSVPCAPPPPLSFKGAPKMGSTPALAPPPSSLNVKGQKFSCSLGSKNSQTRKLKPLHWLKLTRAVQGSLWAETQKSEETSIAPEIDMSELENLFSASAPNSDAGGTGGKYSCGRGAPKSDKVQLIDHRRAYNCEIMLSKIKVPLQELMCSVLSLEDSSLDIDQVENLIKFCPTKDDMELLKGYAGAVDKLGKCEQFFLELMRVPRVEAKLRVFLFKMQFRAQVSDLRKSLNIVNSTADQVRNSVKLKRIMQTVLSLGNALNQGTARGSAVGFRLDSLLKLTETRARNNRMTLMHYLCKVIAEKLPELLDFSKDLTSIEPATKIQLKILAEEMQAINQGLEKVVQELSVSEIDGPVSDEFRKNLKEFLCFAEAEVRSLALLYSGVGRHVDALIVYFGEDPARCPFEQVVTTLLNFTRMFNRAHEENCKRLEL